MKFSAAFTDTNQTLATPRLRLRAITTGDNAFLRRLLTDPVVRAYLGGPIAVSAVPTHRDRYHAAGKAFPFWTVLHELAPIGLISLTPHKDGNDIELSYQFVPESHGKGLALEATRAVLDRAAANGTPRIIAETQAANEKSVALLHRLKMTQIDSVERFGALQLIFATRD